MEFNCFDSLAHDSSLLRADTTGLEEQEREKRRQVMEKFQKAPFEEIAAHCESKVIKKRIKGKRSC